MTSKPAKFHHVKQFCVCFAIQLPLQQQVEIALKHKKYPVGLIAIPDPIPCKSDVKLPEHESQRTKSCLFVAISIHFYMLHCTFDRVFFNFGVLSLNLGSLFIIYFQLGAVVASNVWHLN